MDDGDRFSVFGVCCLVVFSWLFASFCWRVPRSLAVVLVLRPGQRRGDADGSSGGD